MLRVKRDLGAGTAQYDCVGLDPPDLIWLHGGHVIFVERPYDVDPRDIRSPEHVIGINQNDEGGEGERRYRNKCNQSDGKASKRGAGWRWEIGSLAGRRD
jgi:hypothetical protein